MPEHIFNYKQIDNGYIIEMKITKVEKDEHYPEGIKYSLVIIDRKTKKRILGFDNHKKKGHHIHKLDRGIKHDFIDEWKLVGDFMKEYEDIKGGKV